jgi:hypothetical protein
MPKNDRRHWKKNVPPLGRVKYGTVYCELCKSPLRTGQLVGWWKVHDAGGRMRTTAYCTSCHHRCAKAGFALR